MSHNDHSGHHGHFEDHHGHHMGQDTPSSVEMLSKNSIEPSATPPVHTMMMEMMQMTFHLGTNETLLFKFWQVEGPVGMALSCTLIFVMAFLYEGLKTARMHLAHRERRSRYTAVRTVNGLAGSASGTPEEDIAIRSGILNLPHIQQTALYMVQLTLAYVLMLLFMCFNVWICLAIVWGAGLGYFTFGWYRSSTMFSASDHCSA